MKEVVLSFEEKKTNFGLPTLKLPASAWTILRLARWILLLMISVYDY